jgi:hypothetical protein
MLGAGELGAEAARVRSALAQEARHGRRLLGDLGTK